jgi:periplasmic mercuric ion binding protein
MKFLQATIIAFLFFIATTNAQYKVSNKAVIKTPGITCELCQDRVERALFKAYGISSTVVNVKKHTVTVTWLTDRTNIENIKTMIANAGYDADDVKAEPSAIRKIPAGCRMPGAIIVDKPKVDTVVKAVTPIERKPTALDSLKKRYSRKPKG